MDDEEDSVEISLEGEEEIEREEAQRDEGQRGEAQPEGDRQGRRRRRRRRGGRGRGRAEGADGEASPPVEQSDLRRAARAPKRPSSRRRPPSRRATRTGAVAADARPPAENAEQAEIEPGSSPMVERPIDDEPPIAQTEPAEEAKPKPKRARSKKAAPRSRGARTGAARGPASRNRG